MQEVSHEPVSLQVYCLDLIGDTFQIEIEFRLDFEDRGPSVHISKLTNSFWAGNVFSHAIFYRSLGLLCKEGQQPS